MKGRLIALDHWQGREAAALMVDGQLEDLLVDCVGVPRLGTVFLARVERPLKGQGGVIVDWGSGQGFLRRAKGMKPGEKVRVQVSGFAEQGKAPPVTDRLLFKSRYAIVTPDAPGINVSRAIRDDDRRDALKGIGVDAMGDMPHGLILRSAAVEALDAEIAEDIDAMVQACMEVLEHSEIGLVREGDGPHLGAWCEWSEAAQVETAEGSFEALGVLDAIDHLAQPDIALGPHSVAVEETRALIAVDVNTGGDLSPAAGLKANLAAIRELPRQLRLRGLAGQITVDLAPVSKKDRRQIETALRAALKADVVETEFVGWTPLGHIELKRKRERPPLFARG